MRTFFLIIISICTFFCCISKKYPQNIYDDIGFTIYNGVENYYYTYLEFPKSVDDITDFLWEQRLNKANNYHYQSFDEFYRSKDIGKVRNRSVENTICFLDKNRTNISLSVFYDTLFILNYCDKDTIEISLDYCEDKSTPWDNKFSRHYFHTYNSVGKITKEDYVEKFDSIQKRLLISYPNVYTMIDHKGDTIVNYLLLRYDQNKQISSICPDDTVQLHNNPYIKEMVCALDSLIDKDKEIYSIMFLAALRYQ